MKSRRFPWKIYGRVVFAQIFIVLAALTASGLAARHYFKQSFLTQVESQLQDHLVAISRDMGAAVPITWCADHALSTDYRLTVIERGGGVVCDSHHDPATMQNHSERPEILEAESGRFGSSVRESATLGEPMLYGAIPVRDGALVIRAALPLDHLFGVLRVLDASLGVILVLVGGGLTVFGILAGRAIVKPMSRVLDKAQGVLGPRQPDLDGDGEPGSDIASYGEWNELESSLESIHRDVRAKAESLAVEREELATLMGAITDAILAVDVEGTPLFYNSRFVLLSGDEQGLARRTVRIWELFRAPEIIDSFRAALSEGRSGQARAIPIEAPGEGKRFFSLSVAPLRKSDGSVYGAVGVFHDVTDLKSAEQIRIDFVANVSHELRTPLTAIKGYIDTIAADAAEGRPAEKSFVEIVSRNAERLMELIQDLLDLSSLESPDSGAVLTKSPIPTGEITSRIINQLKGGFAAKQQVVTTDIQAAIVSADSRRLEQVIVNLLDNASKYTPAGGQIRLSWEHDGTDVLLKIRDNGPGIPAHAQPRLFERFYRVDKARSREQGGTGLGLAIVKHILQRHDGAVWVESEVGRGSTFVCRFPG